MDYENFGTVKIRTYAASGALPVEGTLIKIYGTDDYNMSDNWLFRNLVWTSEQVAEYAEAMVAKMQDMTWFPLRCGAQDFHILRPGTRSRYH